MAASGSVQSVVRAAEILELVSTAEGGLTLKQLSLALNLKPQTVHNLASTLARRRLLEKLAHPPRYRLGEALLEMAARHGERELSRRAEAAVRELVARIPQATVLLAQGVGGEVQVLRRMSPERPGVAERPRQQVLSAYASSTTLVFQAFWTDEERSSFRRRYPFEEFGAGVWQSEAKLERFLAKVRRQGYALLPPSQGKSLRVAVPLFGAGNELRAVLGASVPAGDPLARPARHAGMVRTVREVARRVSIHP
jgi:DNA-binding IclR family transcriptional regulator